jgi:hypothetical protein
MRAKTAAGVWLLLVASAAGAGIPTPDVRLVKSSDGPTHVYGIHASKGAGKKASRIVLAIRGPRPSSAKGPRGWRASIGSASSGLWGCNWEIEWSREQPGSAARLPIRDLLVAFADETPRSWCWCEVTTDHGIVSFGGPDAVAVGVS